MWKICTTFTTFGMKSVHNYRYTMPLFFSTFVKNIQLIRIFLVKVVIVVDKFD